PVSYYSSRHHRDLHSFLTRRSSDLLARIIAARVVRLVVTVAHEDAGSARRRQFGTGEMRRLQLLEGEAGQTRHIHAHPARRLAGDRKSTRLNSSHVKISYAVFCLKK